MFTLNNKTLQLDTAFTTEDGTQYPPNWLRLASAEEKAAIGITEQDDLPSFDDRFYWSAGNPKDLDVIKSNLISQIKATAASLLAPTDWKIIRFIESTAPTAPIGTDVTDYRTAVRTASNTNEAAVNACVTMFEIESLQFTWPEL